MDIAKGIGILLVVLGHTHAPKELHDFIYIFHMPLFFIISGYLFNFEKWKYRWIDFLKSRSIRLAFPYLFMSSCILFPLWILESRFDGKGTYDFFRVFVDVFYGSIIYGDNLNDKMPANLFLWFLPCLFVGEILFFGILKLASTSGKRVVCIVASGVLGYSLSFYCALPWCIDIALTIQVFLGLGYFIRQKKADLNRIALVVAAISLLVSYHYYSIIDTINRWYGNIFLYWLGGISGSVLVFSLSKKLVYVRYLKSFLLYCGKESLGILIWQAQGFKFSSAFFVLILHLPHEYALEHFWPVYFVFSSLSCLILVYMKNHLRAKLLSKNHTRLALLLNW